MALSDLLKGASGRLGKAFALAGALSAPYALEAVSSKPVQAAQAIGGDYHNLSRDVSRGSKSIYNIVKSLEHPISEDVRSRAKLKVYGQDDKVLELVESKARVRANGHTVEIRTPKTDLVYDLRDSSFQFKMGNETYVCNSQPDVKLASGPEPLNDLIGELNRCNSDLQGMFPMAAVSYHTLRDAIQRVAEKPGKGWEVNRDERDLIVTYRGADGFSATFLLSDGSKQANVNFVNMTAGSKKGAVVRIYHQDGNLSDDSLLFGATPQAARQYAGKAVDILKNN